MIFIIANLYIAFLFITIDVQITFSLRQLDLNTYIRFGRAHRSQVRFFPILLILKPIDISPLRQDSCCCIASRDTSAGFLKDLAAISLRRRPYRAMISKGARSSMKLHSFLRKRRGEKGDRESTRNKYYIAYYTQYYVRSCHEWSARQKLKTVFTRRGIHVGISGCPEHFA